MNHYLRWPGIVLLFAAWVSPATAAIDASVEEQVRDFINDGGALFEQGQFEAAHQKWIEALGVLEIPTAALWAARASSKLGRLVAAAQLYERALAMQPNELWKLDKQQQAQALARDELAALVLRIPTLRIELLGTVGKDLVCSVDGSRLSVAALASAQRLEPGPHVVSVTSNGKTVTTTATLVEGEKKTVTLRLTTDPSPSAPNQESTAAPATSTGSARSVAIFSSLGVGAAGLVLGSSAGLIALNKHSSLKSAGCTSDTCVDETLKDKIDSYNTTRTISTVGFVVAGVGAAVGVTLWLTKPKPELTPAVGFTVTPNMVVARGAF